MVFFSQEKKQQKLILILIGVIIAIFVTVYFGFIRPQSATPGAGPIAGEMPEGGTVSVGGSDIENIDFFFLQDPRFQELKKYGEWPIIPRETGRENPFEPFEGYTANKQAVEEVTETESIEEAIEEETLEEVIIEEPIIEEPIIEEETDEESIERATIEELLRLLNGGGE